MRMFLRTYCNYKGRGFWINECSQDHISRGTLLKKGTKAYQVNFNGVDQVTDNKKDVKAIDNILKKYYNLFNKCDKGYEIIKENVFFSSHDEFLKRKDNDASYKRISAKQFAELEPIKAWFICELYKNHKEYMDDFVFMKMTKKIEYGIPWLSLDKHVKVVYKMIKDFTSGKTLGRKPKLKTIIK